MACRLLLIYPYFNVQFFGYLTIVGVPFPEGFADEIKASKSSLGEEVLNGSVVTVPPAWKAPSFEVVTSTAIEVGEDGVGVGVAVANEVGVEDGVEVFVGVKI